MAVTSDRLLVFQVLGYASLSLTMFTGIQQEYNRPKDEREEAIRAADRYREDLHNKKEELKGAIEVLSDCRHSILSLEKEKEHAGLERDRARADIKQAKALLQENYRSLQVATREQDSLRAEIAAKVAKARVDAFQEYKNSFKDMMDYLFLMRDAVNEYKASIKKVDPTFDGDYYDCLISGEPATLAP